MANTFGGLRTFIGTDGQGSNPNLTCCNCPVLNKILDWKVLDLLSNNNHRYITFKVTGTIVRIKSKRFNTSVSGAANFQKLSKTQKEQLSGMFSTIHIKSDLNDAIVPSQILILA